MASLTSHRFLPLLLVISLCGMLYFLTGERISQSINFQFYRALLSVREKHIVTNVFPDMYVSSGNKDNTTPPTAGSTTRKAYLEPMATDHLTPVTPDNKVMGDLSTYEPTSSPVETPIPILFKKDFEKLPRRDFEDVYIPCPQPRQTTCPNSLWKTEDPSFKEAAIPDIGLFMHKESVNISEWNRLAHFNNPFGFMEYNYNEVKAAVDLIPKPKEPLLFPRKDSNGCVRCAVVGTAGILNGSHMGQEIDSHDYVFRMNGAVTEGYEEDVGGKTSVYVHTAHSITASLYYFKKYGFKTIPHNEGIKYVMIPEGLRDFQWLQGLLSRERVSNGPYKYYRPWTYYAGQFDENRFYVLHPDFLRYVRNRFLKSSQLNGKHWAIVRPTNGAFTLFLALHTCDVVDAYGFMTEDYSKYPNYYVERHTKTNVIFFINHDYIMEMKTWKKLHDTNIMKLYQRKDSGTDS